MGIFNNLRRLLLIPARRWSYSCDSECKPKHLICFKQWTSDMVWDCVQSAIRLKQQFPDTHMQKCKAKQSPLLLKMSTDIVKEIGGSESAVLECTTKDKLFKNVNVVIAGPTTDNKEKVKFFALDIKELDKYSKDWIFIHCCPRGKEVADSLFNCPYALTYSVFHNMQYIAASLMANAINDHVF